MTDTPSFISGDKIVIVEPHMRIFNGIPFRGGVQGSFTKQGQGMKQFPGQLELFACKEKINFSKPYNGTIFRFPLRTQAQAKVSELSKSAYPVEKVIAVSFSYIVLAISLSRHTDIDHNFSALGP